MELVQYLNRLRRETDEPIRIIAHSHGCNVVKLASMSRELSADVHISKAVFLACPHFWEANYEAEEPTSVLDKFKFKRLRPHGRKYRYRASPERFGRIFESVFGSRSRAS
jgi:predicted alpha/beta hydrolase family esterase